MLSSPLDVVMNIYTRNHKLVYQFHPGLPTPEQHVSKIHTEGEIHHFVRPSTLNQDCQPNTQSEIYWAIRSYQFPYRFSVHANMNLAGTSPLQAFA
jgi:hypothetical protein